VRGIIPQSEEANMTGKIAIRSALVILLLVGLASSASPQPSPLAGTAMHIESIGVSASASGGGYPLWSAGVTIRDEFGFPVNGATVKGDWSGCITKKGASGVTQSWYNAAGELIRDGMAKVDGRKHPFNCPDSCSFVFTVTNVTKSGMTYDSSANVVSSGSQQCWW